MTWLRFPLGRIALWRLATPLLVALSLPAVARAQGVADLAITKTDGVTTATPGGSVTYTITASNAGPDNATGATVADTFSAALTCTWTCVAAGGGTCTAAGSGNINNTVNLPAGGSVTYTASCVIASAATGSLSNTATVSAPAGITDPTPANNSATDTDTLFAQADLAITKTDGITTAMPGGAVTYTITASNAGPSSAAGATVADTFPAVLTACSWTCVSTPGGACTSSGTGSISDTVNLPPGASMIYTAVCAIAPGATGLLTNTATVSPPAGVTDPNPGNNSATDTDTLSVQADLAITKTDGVTTATPGGSVTYTIVASNAGPAAATGAIVADTFPAALTTCTWTCVSTPGGTCTSSGTGSIIDIVSLPAGGSVIYTAFCSIAPGATGSLNNTATVSPPAGVTDPNPGNNTATDTDTLLAPANLAITKTDGVTTATPGGSVTYTIVASNAGPAAATGATVADTFPAALTTCTWTCVGAGAGTCSASGSGNINDTVNLPAGGSVSYTAVCSIAPGATGSLVNTATVSPPAGVSDPTPANNTATDTDTLAASADLAITKIATPDPVVAGQHLVYTITISNGGPSAAASVTLSDALPASATFVSLTAPGGWSCTTPPVGGGGAIACTIASLGAGSSVFTLTAAIAPTAAHGTVVTNTATVSSPTSDPTSGNNSATASTVVSNTGPACDVDGDGSPELITGAGPGGEPHVRVWNVAHGSLNEVAGFFAFSPSFQGGVFVACGDLTGDGIAEIVTGAGSGGPPHVRVWKVAGGSVSELGGFFAYHPGFAGGVSVAVGDVTGDGIAEIVTGAGPGGAPHVRAWNVAGGSLSELGGFFAYHPGFAGGVSVAVGDVTGDGIADLITGAGPGGAPHVRVWNVAGGSLSEFGGFYAYDPAFTGGVRVGR